MNKKVKINVFSCMLTFVIANGFILEHSVDSNMHKSCKNAPKMFINIYSIKYCKENSYEVPV